MQPNDICSCCGSNTPIDALDAKPRLTLWLWIVRLFVGQERMLNYAAARGCDFDILECSVCYGPGYEPSP